MILRSLVSFFVLVVACLAQDVARMDEVVQSYVSNGQFAGSVLVARGGDVLFSKAYGLANREWDVPNTPNTKFRIGSVTKQFTAAAILLLQERGKLKIDDPVKTHLADAPEAWDESRDLPSVDAHVRHSKLYWFFRIPPDEADRYSRGTSRGEVPRPPTRV